MPWLLALVEGWLGPKFARFARPLIYLVAALLLAFAALVAVKIHDRRVVATANDRQGAANANADKHADDNAGDQRVTDALRLQDEKTKSQEAINEAHRSGADPRAAYYQCVRKQQAARHAGQPSPAC
jgi:hypothetical protein